MEKNQKINLKLRKTFDRFRNWQKGSYQFNHNAMQEKHICHACGTKFHGRYCPLCGQPASVGRYSYRQVMKNFLYRWGIGDRSFFRTLRDLFLRPGYLIRDYLQGQQMAYYPPINMLFVMVAVSLLSSTWGHPFYHWLTESWNYSLQHAELKEVTRELLEFTVTHQTLTCFCLVGAIGMDFVLFFRRSPNFDSRMRFSEMFVTLVYLACLFLLFKITSDTWYFIFGNGFLYKVSLLLILPYTFVTLWQLTGCRFLTVLLRMTLVFLTLPFILLIFLFIIGKIVRLIFIF